MGSQLSIFLTLVAGAAIPLVVSFLTKAGDVNNWVRTLVSVPLAFVTAIGQALANVDGATNWKEILAVGVGAAAVAGGTLASTWGKTFTTWVHDHTDEWLGLGKAA